MSVIWNKQSNFANLITSKGLKINAIINENLNVDILLVVDGKKISLQKITDRHSIEDAKKSAEIWKAEFIQSSQYSFAPE